MNSEFINLTLDNIDNEHLCCIIRTKKNHPGVEAKREWLKDRLPNGHVFRKLNEKATVFVEYAPLEQAWVPIEGDNYYYIYCLWVLGGYRKKGYGRSLMEYVINDAKKNKKSGICMLASQKQKAWLSVEGFAKKFGFVTVDTTNNGYELLAKSFDGTTPKFMENAKKEEIDSKELTIYYDMQCPYVYQTINFVKEYCTLHNLDVNLIKVDTLEKAKNLPCVFNNFAVFYKGGFQTVNLLDINTLKRILNK